MRNYWMLILAMSLLVFYACEQLSTSSAGIHVEQEEGFGSSSETNCEELQSQFDTTHYFIQLTEKAMKRVTITDKNEKITFIPTLQDTIQKYLGFVYANTEIDISEDSVAYTCPCGLVLMETNHPIDPTDGRGATHSGKPGTSSDSMFLIIDNNYIFPITPADTILQPLKSNNFLDTIPTNTTPRDSNKVTGLKTRIAIIDSGLNSSHKQLRQNLWYNPRDTLEIRNQNNPYHLDNDHNGIINDVNGFNFAEGNMDLSDYTGHGTHVAGIVTGSHNNGYSKYNDYEKLNQSIELMNVKIIGQDTNQTNLFTVLCAMNYAIDSGADIINASWGYYATETSKGLKEVVKRAADSSVIIVAAAGNDAKNIDVCSFWPASMSPDSKHLVSVAAAKKGGKNQAKLVEWSNFGHNSVDIAAEGEKIESTFPKNESIKLSGTSMAAPAVTRFIAWQRLKIQKKIALAKALDKASESGIKDSIPPFQIDVTTPTFLPKQHDGKKQTNRRKIYLELVNSLDTTLANFSTKLQPVSTSHRRLKQDLILTIN